MMSNIRCFRNRTINFDATIQLILNGNRIEAKRKIDKLFRGVTNAEVGYGILKLIEKSGNVPSDDELASYITRREEEASNRKLQTSIGKAHVAKITKVEKTSEGQKYAPKCPTCSSTNIEPINLSTRAAATVLFGVVSKTARSQFCCKNCGYKW